MSSFFSDDYFQPNSPIQFLEGDRRFFFERSKTFVDGIILHRFILVEV